MIQRHTIHFSQCPSFSEIAEIAKEYYVVKTCERGSYAIILELSGNGKINYGVL